MAKESATVIDEFDVVPQRKALHHAFARGIQPTAVFDRTKPQSFLKSDRGTRVGNAALLRSFQSSRRILSLDVLEALFTRFSPELSRRGQQPGSNYW